MIMTGDAFKSSFFFWVISLVVAFSLKADGSPNDCLRRINGHMLICDYPSACMEGYRAIYCFPKCKLLFEAYIKALAKAGDEKGMCQAWRSYAHLFPQDALKNEELHEYMAWAIIERASNSSSPIIRLSALIGSFFGQDAKGIVIMEKLLHDPNHFIRAAAVQLSSQLRDDKLGQSVYRLLKEEKSWKVRLEAIKAVGKMKIARAKPDLLQMLSSQTTVEEQASAVKSLADLMDKIDPSTLDRLFSHEKAALRWLACELAIHHKLECHIARLISSVQDNHPQVRASALRALGLLNKEGRSFYHIKEVAKQSVKDPDPSVAIIAAWLLTLASPPEGQLVLSKWLLHPLRDRRLQAAAALVATGKYGMPLLLNAFENTQDPYVKLNLSLGLITQHVRVESGCQALYEGVVQIKEKWGWQQEDSFRYLAPSKLKHEEGIVNLPESTNQLVRLEILNILAVMHFQRAQEAIQEFLQEKNWGVSALASALLLTEGDEDALQLVKNLLNSAPNQIKMQAAMVYALWGGGEEAVSLLESSYQKADREVKERILESLGRIGSRSSIPFLLERFEDSLPTLRIIAAAALLQCLYH